MDEERYTELLETLKKLDAHEHKLSRKEAVFVEDMIERLERYRTRTHVSAKQLEWIEALDRRIWG